MASPAELYAQLVTAFNRHEWHQAQHLAARLLPAAPHHPGVHYIAGIACLELKQLPTAIELLRKAASLEPANVDYLIQLAKALTLSGSNRDAKAIADQARALTPGEPTMLDTLGVIYSQVGDYTSAAEVFRQATALAPQHAPYHYNFATSLIASGHIGDAESELEACLALDPRNWLAHLTLAKLRRQTAAANHVPRLEALLETLETGNSDVNAAMCIHMALAKEYEDLADYPRAFSHIVRGKSAGAAGRDYSIRRDEDLFAAITESFGRVPPTPKGHVTDEPIFVIGMPRSGTTLVERIISSHPDVSSVGELLNFGMVLKHMSGSQTPALIDVDTIVRGRDVQWHRLGESYLSSTRPATGQRPHFIDKLPHNFLYAGFIASALPRARIICLRRDPLDTCLSNFRQLFGPRSPFFDYSFDLLDTGRYYVLFDRLMAHWQRMFPGRILEVDYETLVESQESSSRQLLDFCDLPWNEACLRFENNPLPVATASAVQVRAPIYRTALRRWKNYEPQLVELRQLLLDAGVKLAE